jgi:hypothetical protein
MRPAIELNNEPLLQANEIDDEMANRLLATEAELIELSASQEIPEPLFGTGHFLPQPTGGLRDVGVDHD